MAPVLIRLQNRPNQTSMELLVPCNGNSAPSILNRDSAGGICAYSAGSTPSGRVHPKSLKLLAARGYPTDGLSSPSWDNCAADHAPVQAHWGIPDPAAAIKQDWDVAFQTAFDTLTRKAAALINLPFETIDAAALKSAINGTTDV
ncbi:putative arsenate reductase ArsC [Octadecabacter antarcticus 307]|uniref:Putative arsenate reductase ArsC n=2 Tax=Octadecabacter TaxID=53945 RepID=M9RE03_9RHOB|nr:putative arsenate reductase ArsC [Octadecabacter antarcticus 307]